MSELVGAQQIICDKLSEQLLHARSSQSDNEAFDALSPYISGGVDPTTGPAITEAHRDLLLATIDEAARNEVIAEQIVSTFLSTVELITIQPTLPFDETQLSSIAA